MTEKTLAELWQEMFALNVNDLTEERGDGKKMLTYLPWTYAWAEVKKRDPYASFTVWRDPETHLPYVYDPCTGYMVFTTVTIAGKTQEMFLQVIDSKNRALKAEPYTYSTKYGDEKTVEAATMQDIGKSIIRCLVKNVAVLCGLSLYIYSGDDLPEAEANEQKEAEKREKDAAQRKEESKKNELLQNISFALTELSRTSKTGASVDEITKLLKMRGNIPCEFKELDVPTLEKVYAQAVKWMEKQNEDSSKG